MSEPTYRIETAYDPAYHTMCWLATVYRVSDDAALYSTQDVDEKTVTAQALSYITRAAAEKPKGHTLFTSEDGVILGAPEPASLRVAP